MRTVLVVFFLTLAFVITPGFIVQSSEWDSYKTLYGKSYDNIITEKLRRFYYAVNKAKIMTHNNRYERNHETYRLDVNQFTDLRFLEFAALFPTIIGNPSNRVPYTAPAVVPQASFSYAAQGFVSDVQNQGLVCNSGWAYATATAVQIFDASITGNLNSQSLSAQNLIDCAGGPTACRKQTAQTAFDYLTNEFQKLYPQSEYHNNPLGVKGMCILPVTSTTAKTLKAYSNIADGNDEVLKTVVNYVAPVITMLNPGTFEFMHYKEGIFTQPTPTKNAAHYMTVVGYDSATGTGNGFWLLQNSFGSTWGEAGIMRIEINSAKSIANSAIFPLA